MKAQSRRLKTQRNIWLAGCVFALGWAAGK
jgi:hypothetical protein